MSLVPGTRLGPYEIVAPLGAGGMGEVYRAKDTRLGRDVAIKALPDAFAQDPERLARFEREARLLASLSHANIAGIHGLEHVEGHRYLVLEFVEGETLGARLARGPMRPDEAADVCRQIAAGVEAAHEAGVVHRDLKPGNVMLKADGTVKVLDFGLAKGGAGGSGSSSDPNLSASPTLTHAATAAGVILGTAAYMSPEQARGKSVDRRTDIWSFGCVLYECLAGRPAYEGETVSDLIARILEREPDWTLLPADTPDAMRRLMRRCLTRDARERLRDIGEARITLGGAREPDAPAVTVVAGPARGHALRNGALAAALLAAGLLVGAFLPLWRSPVVQRTTRLAVMPPNPEAVIGELGTFALSPDGTALAFVLADSAGTSRLCVRPLDADEPRVLDGTEGAAWPFWSPDSRDLAFFAAGKLRRVPAAGGAVRVICDASSGRGGAWGSAGVIVFAPDPIGGLSAVDPAGGSLRALTVVDTTVGDNSHRFPRFLPDGRHFLFIINNTTGRPDARVMVASLDDPHAKHLFDCQSAPEFAAPDWVLFTRDRALLAQRLDLRALKMTGEARLLPDQPEVLGPIQLSRAVSCSRTGLLAYAPPDRRPTAVDWLESDGRYTATRVRLPGGVNSASLAPDGHRLAVGVVEPEGYANWVADLAQGTAAQVARAETGVDYPTWNPAGTRFVGPTLSGLRQVDPGTGADSAYVLGDKRWRIPGSWTPDGRTMVLSTLVPGRRYDLETLSLRPGEKPRPYLATTANEAGGELSHDGRWVAYQTDASGTDELCVERFPDHAEAVRTGVGVMDPNSTLGWYAWSADDRTLYFVGGDGVTLYATDVRTTPRLSLNAPRAIRTIPRDARAVVLAEDGRLLVLHPEGPRSHSISVVQGWTNDLEKSR